LSLGILFTVISNIFVIIPAQLVRIAIDYVVESYALFAPLTKGGTGELAREYFLESVFVFGILILVMALLRGFFLFLIRQTLIIMSRKIEYDMKNELFEHFQFLPLSFYRKNSTGDLMARISEDVSRVRMYLGPAIMYGLNLLILFPLVISYMISVNLELTLYSLLPLPILSLSIYYVNNQINLRSEKILQDHLFEKEKEGKISIIWNHQVDEVLGDAKAGVTSVRLKSTQDDSTQEVEVSGMFVAIGHKPNSSMFEGQLQLRDGYIQVQSGTAGNATQTSIPGVFAAGDIADSVYRQAITSAGSGCMAALDAEKYLDAMGKLD